MVKCNDLGAEYEVHVSGMNAQFTVKFEVPPGTYQTIDSLALLPVLSCMSCVVWSAGSFVTQGGKTNNKTLVSPDVIFSSVPMWFLPLNTCRVVPLTCCALACCPHAVPAYTSAKQIFERQDPSLWPANQPLKPECVLW